MRSSFNPLQLLCTLFLLAGFASETSCFAMFNVQRFGARGDSRTDTSKAFLLAWKEACASKGGAGVLVPQGYYLLNPITFQGPCKGFMEFQVEGLIKAPANIAIFNSNLWIRFLYVNGLKVTGHGTFDGQGVYAWRSNDCSKNEYYCKLLPPSIRFDFIANAVVQFLHSINSKLFHINIFASKNMILEYLTITAPADSPNTDGIHIGKSNNITILHSTIGTGDDCISLSPGSFNIQVSDVTCGPGHGISVGSLGKYANEDNVIGLTVMNCTFINTSNGVRIKTWAPSYPSIASKFTFQDIHMVNVENPIVINQQYCPFPYCNSQTDSMVHIRDVTYQNIWGTSASKVAVDLLCSRKVPCKNIIMKNINLIYNAHERTSSSCVNVNGVSYGKISSSCLIR